MRITYKGLKPGTSTRRRRLSRSGRFRGGALDAEKLLVKCPSKYQGLDQKASTS